MSRLGALVRTGLKANFGFALLAHRLFREKKDLWLVPLIGFSLLGVVPLLLGLVEFIRTMFRILQPMGQERVILTVGILSGQLAVLVFGVYYVMSALYFSRDLEMLVPLPVRPSEVVASKFAVLLVNEYLTVAVLVLPFLITYGVLAGGGAGYWVNAVLVYLALPVIPLLLIAVVVIPMMRGIRIGRRKDFLIVAGGVAVVALAFGFQFFMQKAHQESLGAPEMAALLASPDGLIQRAGSGFPPGIWATHAIAGGFSLHGLSYLALFLGTSGLLSAAVIFIGGRLFYGGVVGLAETSAPRRILTDGEMARRVSSGRRPVRSISLRELRIMNRTPVFLLNGILTVVLLPVLFVFATLTGADRQPGDIPGLPAEGNAPFFTLGLALFFTVCGSVHGAAASSFSREGAQFWISRVIPMPPPVQVTAKFCMPNLIGALGIAAAAAAAAFSLPVPPARLCTAAALALAVTALFTAVGMILDLARPLLDWTNPQKAMKQNLNVLLSMVADAGILALAYWGICAALRAGMSEGALLALLMAVASLCAACSFLALRAFSLKRYPEIES